MQKNTKVTAKLRRLPAHNVWCLSSLSHESDRYLRRKKYFPLGFLRVIDIKVPRSCRAIMRYANSILLITLITSVMRISSSLKLRRRELRAEWKNSERILDKTETSRSWSRNVVKSIFAVFKILNINVISSSLWARSLPITSIPPNCNIIPAEYFDAEYSIEKPAIYQTHCSATSFRARCSRAPSVMYIHNKKKLLKANYSFNRHYTVRMSRKKNKKVVVAVVGKC